jgi:DNA-binding transcriptional MerR regulator
MIKMDRKTQKEIDELSKETTYTFEHIKGLCDRHKQELLNLRKLYFPICDIKALLENGHIESAIDMLSDVEKQLEKEEAPAEVCECYKRKPFDIATDYIQTGKFQCGCGKPIKEV